MLLPRNLRLVAKFSSVLTLSVLPALLHADSFTQVNLVSSTPGVAATTDANLQDPWGFAYSATSPFWISNQGSNTSTLYDGAGNKSALTVTIPGVGGTGPAGPTGQVFVGGLNFGLSNGSSANFIFDTLQGTIAGWNSAAGTTAITMSTINGAVYTGLAEASSGGSNYLYAADSTGQIRVFNNTFTPVSLTGNFTDPNAIAGYVPFNIQLIGSQLYVTYARLNNQGIPLTGGYVDIFNTNGTFVSRFATGGPLYGPWGVAQAPASFGSLGGDILIGNNGGTGEISAFNPVTGQFVTTLDGTDGQPIQNQDLWAIGFRTGGTNDNTNDLYFTAGENNQNVFGEIVGTPEPASVVLTGFGILSMGLFTLLRKRE